MYRFTNNYEQLRTITNVAVKKMDISSDGIFILTHKTCLHSCTTPCPNKCKNSGLLVVATLTDYKSMSYAGQTHLA